MKLRRLVLSTKHHPTKVTALHKSMCQTVFKGQTTTVEKHVVATVGSGETGLNRKVGVAKGEWAARGILVMEGSESQEVGVPILHVTLCWFCQVLPPRKQGKGHSMSYFFLFISLCVWLYTCVLTSVGMGGGQKLTLRCLSVVFYHAYFGVCVWTCMCVYA